MPASSLLYLAWSIHARVIFQESVRLEEHLSWPLAHRFPLLSTQRR
jgi:hypothetical protein